MRAKIADEKGSPDIWDLKQVRGGLIDLEFIAQFLQIVSAAKHPEVLDQNTEAALAKLASAGVLAPGDAEILVPAARLYHTLTQVLRLCLDKPFAADEAPRALKDLLARASEMPDFATLEAIVEGHARRRARGLRPYRGVREQDGLKRRRRASALRLRSRAATEACRPRSCPGLRGW